MANEGLVGAFLLGVGGTILFSLLYNIITTSTLASERYGLLPIQIIVIFSFLGFLATGIGLWLIAESGKPKPE
jgi:hypothetical protein